MSHDDPFTIDIDLFGNTALSSGLGLGVMAFAGNFEPDDDPDPSSPAPAMPIAAAARAPSKPVRERGSNFYLTDDRGLAQGWKERSGSRRKSTRMSARRPLKNKRN